MSDHPSTVGLTGADPDERPTVAYDSARRRATAAVEPGPGRLRPSHLTVRSRVAVATALSVLLALVAFELLFSLEVLLDPARDNYLVLDRLPKVLVLGTGAVVVAAALAAWLAGTRALSPLTSIVTAAAHVAESRDFSRRLPEDPRDPEVAQLTATFNHLIQQVDEALSAQRQLVADTSHELKTPLTAIRTSIGLLLDRSVEPEPEIREQLLQNISQSAERMQRLVADVLDLARARLDGMQLQLRRFDAGGLAREVAAPLQPLLDSRQQTLELELPAGPVWVYGDHRRLEQALTNLVSNAHKFSPNGSAIRLGLAKQRQDVAWTVADRGVGIGPEDRPRLFERFFSAPTDAAGHRAGTGLGLPLALAIAQAHGGTIDVQSALGEGSTFTLRVPVAGPPEEDDG
jgi:signal transduction histidine kinase